MQDRIIIHLDMDYFFAQVEERESPQFKGKPVVVGADPKGGMGRGVVSTANYEARKFGIHSAMPISKAYQLCPDAVFLPPNFELYSKSSNNIMNIIRSFSPLMEQVSLDEAYLDFDRSFTIVKKVSEKDLWRQAEKFAEKIKKEIWRQEQLTCSCGIGPNKMIAKIACEDAKPNGLKVVKSNEAEGFVEPLGIRKMPGIGVKTAQILHGSGINTVTDLKKLSKDDMTDFFGARGEDMYKKVRGIDEDPVESAREVKSIGKEHTFEQDTRDPELLIQTFEQIVKHVARRVKEEDLHFKTITVVCRFTGFETHTKAKTLSKSTQDWTVLRREAMKLFLRFLSEKQKAIRLVGVRVVIDQAVVV